MSALLADVTVEGATRLSPSFVRLELGGPDLADLGRSGPWWDQRVKLVLAGEGGDVPRAPDLLDAGPDWYAAWLAMPEGARGAMRTYTVRAVRGEGTATRLVVDVVLHPGAHGPGSAWAEGAGPGSRALLVAPRRGHDFGGVEFRPPERGRMLVVADETAVPAVGSMLEDWPAGIAGSAYLEVPDAEDVLDLPRVPGVEVQWLPRGEGEVGSRLLAAVREHLGVATERAAPVPVTVGAADEDLPWETPGFSAAGEPVAGGGGRPLPAGSEADLHAWVAGESGWVTALRRVLVRDVGLDRGRVAFMGYWRRGVAMRG